MELLAGHSTFGQNAQAIRHGLRLPNSNVHLDEIKWEPKKSRVSLTERCIGIAREPGLSVNSGFATCFFTNWLLARLLPLMNFDKLTSGRDAVEPLPRQCAGGCGIPGLVMCTWLSVVWIGFIKLGFASAFLVYPY